MKSNSEHELLQAIFNEMQELKQALQVRDESRISVKEFAKRLSMDESTLYARIQKGDIQKPKKDGTRSYWLSSYVNEVVCGKMDKVA